LRFTRYLAVFFDSGQGTIRGIRPHSPLQAEAARAGPIPGDVARGRAHQARRCQKLLAEGIDPFVNRQEERRNARMAGAKTFEGVAKELMDKFEAGAATVSS
jgi:hypothetical protein